jgi:hypothetical protein
VTVPAPPGLGSTPPPLAQLPIFSDPMHAVLPMTFCRGAQAAVAFLTTSDGGTTWHTAVVVGSPAVGRIPAAVVDATDWIALPDGGKRVVKVTNEEPVHAAATSGLPVTARGFELEDVSFASPSTGWATVSRCTAGTGHCTRGERLYGTVDGGVSWAPLNTPGAQARH